MRKILGIVGIILVSIIMICCLTSCGNRRYIDFEFDTYRYVHCKLTNECYEVESWTNMDVGIKVKTKEYGVLYFSEGDYILVGSSCPICNHN